MAHSQHHAHHVRNHHNEAASSTSPVRQAHEIDVEAQSQPDARPATHADCGRVRIVDSLKKKGFSGTQSVNNIGQPSPRRLVNVQSHSSSHSIRKRRTGMNNIPYREMGSTTGWQPGEEPGIDTSEPAPPYTGTDTAEGNAAGPHRLHEHCEITCVDYSEENMSLLRLDNNDLAEFLEKPKPEWSQVRWINVNGLSWDVIRAIGNHKGLHRLAIEDLMNTRSRTKADWYSDHAFIVLPLQKLVELEHSDESDSEVDDDHLQKEDIPIRDSDSQQKDDGMKTRYMDESARGEHEEKRSRKRKGAIGTLWQDMMRTKKKKHHKFEKQDKLDPANSLKESYTVNRTQAHHQIRTLQRWHSGPNQDRIQFMERNSALSQKGLGVSMEQVSIFLCADGTVISFFEYSAEDVETPIVRRLRTQGTILRQSGDASMLMESILDAIVDLAIPVTVAYQDTLGDLELEVLTDPAIHESKMIYVLTSEIAVLRNAIAPVVQLMGALKDHKSEGLMNLNQSQVGTLSPIEELGRSPRPSVPQHKSFYNVSAGVSISPLTVMYLGDAEDHALLIQDSYDQMRRSADNLVDLIFNTVSATQNESMKQLTLVTCFFLPLSFLTGYFGMNFESFAAVQKNSDAYFWYIAAPVSVAVLLILLRGSIGRYIGTLANKALISRGRKRRLQRMGRS